MKMLVIHLLQMRQLKIGISLNSMLNAISIIMKNKPYRNVFVHVSLQDNILHSIENDSKI